MSLQKLLIKNIYGVGVYKYLGELIYFLSSIIISRLLVPEEFGVVAMATIFYRFLILFTDLGLTEAIIREDKSDYFLKNAHNLYIIIGLATGTLMALLAYPISIFFSKDVLLLVMLAYAMSLILYSFSKVMIAHLRKENRLRLVAKVELFAVVFQVGCTVILAWAGFSFWSLVLPQIAIPFLYYFVYRQYVESPFTAFSKSGITSVWLKTKSLIFNFGPMYLIQYWERTIDNLLIGKIYGETGLGLYSRAYSMMDLPAKLLEGHVNNILLPLLSSSNLSKKEIKTEMISFIKLISGLITFPAVIFVLFSHELSVLLWGDSWIQVGDYLGILGIALFIVSFDRLSANLFILFRKEQRMLQVGAIKGISIIVLVIIGSFYSMEAIIYLYLAGLFLIGFPATLYFGYYRSFGFSFFEILNTMMYQYILGLIILILKFSGLETLLIYPSLFVVAISLVNVGRYFRNLS